MQAFLFMLIKKYAIPLIVNAIINVLGELVKKSSNPIDDNIADAIRESKDDIINEVTKNI